MGRARFVVALVAALGAAACAIGFFDDGYGRSNDVEVSEAFSFQEEVAGLVRLEIEGINGSVAITGDASAAEARIEGRRRVRSSSRSDARDFLDRVTVEVVRVVDALVVRTRQPGDTGGRELLVEYEVVIPADLRVEILLVNGVVDVSGMKGDLEARVVNGELLASHSLPAGGEADMTLVNGILRLDVPASTSAMLEADVVNGTISVVGLTLEEATTSARSVRGRLGDGDGRIDLQVTNGTITVRGR